MLGKASEIKMAHVTDKEDKFERQLELWLLSQPNAEIIDIKFSVTSLEDFVDQPHALIIYKEGKSS